jgi:large subunit ribosomal protein L9
MKIILTTDVPKVGIRYEVKDFKDGYANVLIAKGLAILATPSALSGLATKKAQMEQKKVEDMKAFDSIIATINNRKIEIGVKANEKGHLFKSVSPRDIALAIKQITGVEIDVDAIVMDHIKEVGTHSIEIKKGSKKGKCEIVVIKA